MFKDKNEELRRLEALLQEEESDEQLLAEAKALTATFDVPEDEPAEEDEVDRFFMEQTQVFTAYNADTTEVTPEELSQAVLDDSPARTSPLVALCCGLATAVLIMILYLVLRYGGLL